MSAKTTARARWPNTPAPVYQRSSFLLIFRVLRSSRNLPCDGSVRVPDAGADHSRSDGSHNQASQR